MSKIKVVTIIFVSLASIIVAAFFIIKYLNPKPGGLKITTTPVSSVYINGIFVGKTPYVDINFAEQINLKLVPDIEGGKQVSYETKINLVSGIQTVVDYEFGDLEETSSGNVISFDRVGGNTAGIVVISSPDNSQVWIDGVMVGSTPYNFNSITTGPHVVIVKNIGYSDKVLNIKTIEGLRLTVFVKLAKDNKNTVIETLPSPTPQALKGYIIIKDTPTGFLRMRTEPGTLGEEIAEVKPEEKYKYLDRDEKTGWYKIQYKDPAPGLPSGITGWVSNQYSSISSETQDP